MQLPYYENVSMTALYYIFSFLQIETYITSFALIFCHWSSHGLRRKFYEHGQLTNVAFGETKWHVDLRYEAITAEKREI